MALAMRGFIPGVPKPSTLQIPSCKFYQQNAITVLQKQHHGLKYSRKISPSLITCRVKKPDVGKGGGSKINGTTSSQQVNSNLSSSNPERTGNQSKGEANASPQKTGANQNN